MFFSIIKAIGFILLGLIVLFLMFFFFVRIWGKKKYKEIMKRREAANNRIQELLVERDKKIS